MSQSVIDVDSVQASSGTRRSSGDVAPMKVVHLCSSDIAGGAARSAYRLHQGLVRLGVDSEMLVLRRVSEDPRVREFAMSRRLSDRLGRKLRGFWRRPVVWSERPLGARSLEVFSNDLSVCETSVLEAIESADVVNLHWVAGMFDFSGLAGLTRRFPVVWTLHDMNAFTGGCHFDGDCGRFVESCGRCPQLESQNSNDLSSETLGRKLEAIGNVGTERLTVVGPSRWLTGESKRSAVFKRFEAVTIPYGLETDIFQPRDRSVVRQLVDIPLDAKVILFAAEGLSNRRKGFDLLVKALGSLGKQENTYLLAVGGGACETAKQLPMPLKIIPTVKDDRFLSFIYSAADVFVMASRADNLPNTVLEAVACGTPVVAFAVGGVPDLVVPERTGVLVAEGDTAGMARAIERLLGDDELRRSMSSEARQVAIERHTLERQATAYVELYGQILRSQRSALVQK